MANFLKVSENNSIVPPYNVEAAIIWSPAPATLRMAAVIAAAPEASEIAAVPPYNAAILVSKTEFVGLVKRP